MSLRLELGRGAALLAESDGDRVVLWADGPAPPGATLHAALREPSLECTIKVLRCQRVGDSSHLAFRMEGRFVNLSRRARQQLLAAFAAEHGDRRDPV